MTSKPVLPKTKRSFDGLDELIDHSIGQKDKYDAMYSPKPLGHDDHSTGVINPAEKVGLSENSARPEHDLSSRVTFRVSVSQEVVMATKMEALRSKMSAADITEKALRQYLNLPPK